MNVSRSRCDSSISERLRAGQKSGGASIRRVPRRLSDQAFANIALGDTRDKRGRVQTIGQKLGIVGVGVGPASPRAAESTGHADLPESARLGSESGPRASKLQLLRIVVDQVESEGESDNKNIGVRVRRAGRHSHGSEPGREQDQSVPYDVPEEIGTPDVSQACLERGVRATRGRILEIRRPQLSRSDQQQFQKDTAQLFPLLPVPKDPLSVLQRGRVRGQGRVHLVDRPRVHRSEPQQDRIPRREHVQSESKVEIDRSQQQSHPLHTRRVLEAARVEGVVPRGEQHSGNTRGDVRR